MVGEWFPGRDRRSEMSVVFALALLLVGLWAVLGHPVSKGGAF